jgi:hypothetical protein
MTVTWSGGAAGRELFSKLYILLNECLVLLFLWGHTCKRRVRRKSMSILKSNQNALWFSRLSYQFWVNTGQDCFHYMY